MIRRVSFVCGVIVILATTCFASVRPMKLEELIQTSDYIVVGTVRRVRSIDGEKIAELEVSRTLKGDPNLRTLYFGASPGWACDVSAANVGETGLFFLKAVNASDTDDEYKSWVKRVERITQGSPLLYISFSGRGRRIFKRVKGQDYLYVWRRGELVFPENLEFASRPDPKYPDLGLVRIDDVIAFVTSYLASKAAA